jgi:hypothetical protein
MAWQPEKGEAGTDPGPGRKSDRFTLPPVDSQVSSGDTAIVSGTYVAASNLLLVFYCGRFVTEFRGSVGRNLDRLGNSIDQARHPPFRLHAVLGRGTPGHFWAGPGFRPSPKKPKLSSPGPSLAQPNIWACKLGLNPT